MITALQFKTLDVLFGWYNAELFGGLLKDCMVNMSRKKGCNGFFMHDAWKQAGGEGKNAHEISLNPDHLDRPEIEWHSTLVHEMCHLWQRDNGHPSRSGYHNGEWAEKMESVGLVPSDTGEPGGKKTGQRVRHYVMTDGPFEKAFYRLADKGLKYASTPWPKEAGKTAAKAASKTKYECPCGNSVWGKPGLNILCGGCKKKFKEAES
jgi:predicted SprT family Zn-dependent metalloprotease